MINYEKKVCNCENVTKELEMKDLIPLLSHTKGRSVLKCYRN